MKNKKSLYIYYHSNILLDREGCRNTVYLFVKKRIEHFLPNYYCHFIKVNESNFQKIISQNRDLDGLAVLITLLNPLLNMQLFINMIEAAQVKLMKIQAEGAVPGTSPLFASQIKAFQLHSPLYTVYSETQRHYNSQLNLGRLRRLKLFEAFMKKFRNLYKMTVEEILDFCGTQTGVKFILSLGEKVTMKYRRICPLCNSTEFHVLYIDIGQPVLGFLTRYSKYYYLCRNCGLVFLSPYMPESDLWRYYNRYMYESEWTLSMLKEHYLHLDHLNTSHFNNYVSVIPHLKKLPQNAKVADLGGGDGEFVAFLKQKNPGFLITLIDFRISRVVKLATASLGIKTQQGNFLNITFKKNSLDLITNWEVIEHLPIEKLEEYFKKINSALRTKGLYIFSTPDFSSPYCRALDFWAMSPGEHLSVLSRKVLEPLLIRCGFTIIAENHECVTMKTKDRWFKYGSEFNSFTTSQAESSIINDFLKDENILNTHLDFMRKHNLGSELILCCQKK